MWEIFWSEVKKFTKIFWIAFVCLTIGYSLFDGTTVQKSLAIYQQVTIPVFLLSFTVLVVTIVVVAALYRLDPMFKTSWLSLFASDEEKASAGGGATNINLAPAKVKFLGPIFLVAFFLILPHLAGIEEEMFRQGTIDWKDGLIRSLVFGLVHCIVGVPLGAGIALTIPGLWFTYNYFVGGVELSTLYHATHNAIAVSLLLLLALMEHLPKRLTTIEQE